MRVSRLAFGFFEISQCIFGIPASFLQAPLPREGTKDRLHALSACIAN